ncbi:glycosyltransferase [Rhodobacteraceae bacterium LMO-12]|nr:glycosyltransferase [Rhodobacteraceae bacterium LMO-JJ12]
MLTEAQIERIRRSGLFDAEWYRQRYPDVARLGLSPLRHYQRLGGALLRDPGPGFSCRFYLAQNPDVAQAGLHPLLHYLESGQQEGRAPHPAAVDPVAPRTDGKAQALWWRALLETGGLEDEPLAGLGGLARGDDPEAGALAAEALGFWALGARDFSTARQWFDQRASLGSGAPGLAAMRVIAAAGDGDLTAARAIVDASPPNGDLHMAATWLARSDSERLDCLNQALRLGDLPELTLAAAVAGTAAIDRLRCARALPPDPDSTTQDAPVISVLMATHDDAAVIETAIASVLAQTWRALELLVIDDASGDDTADIVARAAQKDPRVRLIRLPENLGAYGARNVGLAEAKGAYVTLHDGDDWSHPMRLSRQLHHLRSHPGQAGCLSLQLRATPDLRASRWTGSGEILFENMSSLMLPCGLMREGLGRWDARRVSADSEALRRVRHMFGAGSVSLLKGGPMAVQRDHADSATADSATGMSWFYYGARRDYYEAQLYHHAHADSLYYRPGQPPPFAAPAILNPAGDPAAVARFDHVYAGIMSHPDAGSEALMGWLEDDLVAGRRVALVTLFSMTMPAASGLSIWAGLRARIDGTSVVRLCYGERARCTRLIRLPGQHIPEAQRYLPRVEDATGPVLWPGLVPDGA